MEYSAAIVAYMALAVEFVLRYLYVRPLRKVSPEDCSSLHALSRQYQLMLLSLGFSTICVFIRCVPIAFQQRMLNIILRTQVSLSYLRIIKRLEWSDHIHSASIQ